MLLNDKYIEIKHYVLNRLSTVNSFEMSPFEFRNLFGIDSKTPFYTDLCDFVKKDGMPFHTDGRWKDANGDPSEPIVFKLQ